MEFQFKLIPNNSYHKDILIRVGEEQFVVDSYYFWKEEFSALDNPYNGIYKNISNYFSKWGIQLKHLLPNERVFIPIDFSDQYVGGFSVTGSNKNLLKVTYGYIAEIHDIVIQVQENGSIFNNLGGKKVDAITSFEIDKQKFVELLVVQF